MFLRTWVMFLRKHKCERGNRLQQLSAAVLTTFRIVVWRQCFDYLMTSLRTSLLAATYCHKVITTSAYFEKVLGCVAHKDSGLRWTSLEIRQVNYFLLWLTFADRFFGPQDFLHGILVPFRKLTSANYKFPFYKLQSLSSSYGLKLQILPRKLQQASSATATVASMHCRI